MTENINDKDRDLPLTDDPNKAPYEYETRYSIDGDMAYHARSSIAQTREAFNATCFNKLEADHVLAKVDYDERVKIAAQIREAIMSGEISIAPFLAGQQYYRIDFDNYRGDKDIAKTTINGFLHDIAHLEHTVSNGHVLMEAPRNEHNSLEKFLRKLEQKKEALRDFGR